MADTGVWAAAAAALCSDGCVIAASIERGPRRLAAAVAEAVVSVCALSPA